MLFNIELKAKARDIPKKKKTRLYFAILIYMSIFTLVSILYFCLTYSLRNEMASIQAQLFDLMKNVEQNRELIEQLNSQMAVVSVKLLPFSLINGIKLIPILLLTMPLFRYVYYIMKNEDKTFLECMVDEDFHSSVKKMLSDICLMAIILLKLFLWSLLFVIPAIYKMFCYSQALFIKIEHPEYSANQCIKSSQSLVFGHKSRLFLLELSFIGWYFLIGIIASVFNLFVFINPFLGMGLSEIVLLALHPLIDGYMLKTLTVFYFDLKGDYGQPHVFTQSYNIDPFDNNPPPTNTIDPFSDDVFDSSSNPIDPFNDNIQNNDFVEVKDVTEVQKDDEKKKKNKNNDDIDPFG